MANTARKGASEERGALAQRSFLTGPRPHDSLSLSRAQMSKLHEKDKVKEPNEVRTLERGREEGRKYRRRGKTKGISENDGWK